MTCPGAPKVTMARPKISEAQRRLPTRTVKTCMKLSYHRSVPLLPLGTLANKRQAREDVDSVWAASKAALRSKPVEEKQHRDAATKQADHDRNSRTNTVLAWVATNMLMILVFTSTTFQTVCTHTYAGPRADNPISGPRSMGTGARSTLTSLSSSTPCEYLSTWHTLNLSVLD